MNNLDLRQLGTIMGLPIYVDVSEVPDYRVPSKAFSERDIKAFKVERLLKTALGMPEDKKTQPKVRMEQIGDKIYIMNGVDPLRYVDLTTNKVHQYTPSEEA